MDYIKTKRYRLYLGNMLNILYQIKKNTVTLLFADLPYGMTNNKWDKPIPFNEMWKAFDYVLKENGVIALTGSQPFTSRLVLSNEKMFRHEWIWIKNRGSNFANTVREPFKEHESVLIFSKGNWIYNKQMQERTGGGLERVKYDFEFNTDSKNYGKFKKISGKQGDLRVPSSWQKFNCEAGLHPTQKPVPLLEYLIKTYSNENNIVLDPCMGSGTTGIACLNTGRRFIGIELVQGYFDLASFRIEEHKPSINLLGK